MQEEEESQLESSEFGKLLIGSYSNIMAAQQLQAMMLIELLSQGDVLRKIELENQYRVDFDKKSKEIFAQINQNLGKGG